MSKTIYAKDCKCIKCGKKAVAFWPVIDPDIQSNPYCRDCLTEVKMRALIEINKINEKRNN